jgi:porin
MARKLRSAWTSLNRSGLAATALCLLGLTAAAHAAEPGLWDRPTLGGDLGGVRPLLADRGVSIDLNWIGETFDNFTGGTRRGATFLDRFELATDIDLEKMIGLPGATIHANGFMINGHGLSATNLGNLMPVSGVEARGGVRLYTLWYEQSLLEDRLSLRVGQLAADDEFLISPTAGALLNGTFGWAAIAAANLPSGGPAYPLAAPGARLRVAPAGGDGPALLVAAFAGDPAGKGIGDPQERNENGTTFSTDGGAFFVAEAQYPINRGKAAAGLPGVYKIGGWYHTGGFDDQRFDDTGASLASTASTGTPRRHRGDYGLYAIADQMLWRRPGTEDQGVSAFLRVGGAPSDRNLVAFYVDGGVAYKGLIDSRPDDTLALGVAQAWLSGDARALDRDRNAISGVVGPLRDSETAIELTYTARLAPWWTLQPDVQYIRHPGGNVADPDDATGQRNVDDAVVVGLRTSLKL